MGGKKAPVKVGGFVKVQKNNAYFKTYQVKYKRRREGKTDYRQRRLMINQDKNKYQTPKYRMIARITNKDVICQIASAELKGDRIHASAYAHELKEYGLTLGLANYSAAYCTGLLLARRILTLKGLDKKYPGAKECTGEHFDLVEDEDRRPFKAYLDIGLVRPTVGGKVFACLKGAIDGGLLVPHSDKRFAGYQKEGSKLDAEAHRSRIMGLHVAEWMDEMQEEDNEKYQRHFSRYIKAGIESDSLEDLYKEVHAKIRADPKAKDPTKNMAARKAARANMKQRDFRVAANIAYTLPQRKHRALQKVNAIRAKLDLPPFQK
ncbi:60S ribosomal protein L5-2 [Diplonema papillatum]|nr:60S ribosomal protein L5-2 [Diplonema papillatum]KAJ9450588.1 60S ribosomal protein L5-2 [Diplonema papillatum]KAJ9450589.1 60S ribosomal protein L5-2 [Diplonema papillatum]KAJ9450590.1 60S ribosomal protein L5-2 [Diplonema papillatum]